MTIGGYVKWFTDLPAVHGYPVTVIFPVTDEMSITSHGSSDPKRAGPPEWILRGVKKRISTPIMVSLNYTCTYAAEKVIEELKVYKAYRISFVNGDVMNTAFSKYVREHLTVALFVDMMDEIDEKKAVKSPEEIERIKDRAYAHDGLSSLV